jgi:hypothetical protein
MSARPPWGQPKQGNRGGRGWGGFNPMEAKPSCRHISCPRIAQAIIDFISAKHVGSTAMGPTKGNRRHSRDFFPEISVAGKSRRPPRTTTARLAVEGDPPPPPAGGVRTHLGIAMQDSLRSMAMGGASCAAHEVPSTPPLKSP